MDLNKMAVEAAIAQILIPPNGSECRRSGVKARREDGGLGLKSAPSPNDASIIRVADSNAMQNEQRGWITLHREVVDVEGVRLHDDTLVRMRGWPGDAEATGDLLPISRLRKGGRIATAEQDKRGKLTLG